MRRARGDDDDDDGDGAAARERRPVRALCHWTAACEAERREAPTRRRRVS